MYSIVTLQNCLRQRVGFRQFTNPRFTPLEADLLVSESGLYLNGEGGLHPLMKDVYFYEIFANYNAWYDEYDSTTSYQINDIVQFNPLKKQYRSLTNGNLDNLPPDNPGDWTEISPISNDLRITRDQSIASVIKAVFNIKKLDGITKTLLDNVQLFNSATKFSNVNMKQGRFVGIEFVPDRVQNLAVTLHRLGTQFTEANPDFKLYVYHSSQIEPLQVININLTKAMSFEWTALQDVVLSYDKDFHGPGGSFYVGYFEDDLNGESIFTNVDLSRGDCCNHVGKTFFKNWSQYVDCLAFIVDAQNLNGTNLWDVSQNKYSYSNNYGLNFDLSPGCDLSDFLCRHGSQLDEAIQIQFTADVIKKIAYNGNLRTNLGKTVGENKLLKDQNIFRDQSYLAKKLVETIEALNFNLSDISAICLPCNQAVGIKKRWA